MKFPQAFLTVTCLVGFVSQASAADWWFVPGESDQDHAAIVYVDKASMHRERGTGTVTTWVWTIYRTEQISELGNYRSAKSRVTLECEKKEFGSDSVSFYSAFGGVVHQYRNPKPDMAPIQPKSIDEIMATFMCSDGKMPSRSLPVYDPTRDVEQRFLQYDRDSPSKPATGRNDSAESPGR